MGANSTKPSSSDEQSPVIHDLRDKQIGWNVLVLSITLSTGLVASQSPYPLNPTLMNTFIAIVSIGAATLVNGLFLQNVSCRLSNALEVTGIALMLLCFFLYLSSHLPSHLAWLPILCYFLSVLPTAVAAAIFPPPSQPPLP